MKRALNWIVKVARGKGMGREEARRRPGEDGNLPAVSRTRPTVMAAVYVHVFFHTPSTTAATRKMPKATVKKMPDPRFG